MSLINQMLKDLDARHEAGARGRLHREVRALPKVKENNGLRLLVIGLLALVLAAGGWWAFERYMADAGLPSSEAVTVLPAATPVIPAPPPVAAETTASPAEPAVVENISLDAMSGLKLSSLLDRVPETEPAVAAKGRPTTAPSAQKKAASLAQGGEKPASSRAALAVSTNKDVAPGSVDKTPVAKTVRERSEAEYRKAVTLVNGARIQEATDLLLDVLRQDGGHVASRQLLARLLIEQRRHEEAMAILAEGLLAQPGQVAWAMTLARLQVDRGDLAGAARTLQVSQPFATGNADYQGFAGHVLYRQGRHKEAVDYYQAAVRMAPADGRWWLGLGLVLEADNRAAEAREAYLRARASASLNADLAAVVDQKLR